MPVDLNYIAILVCAIAAMVIGSVWYSPFLFGKIWMKEMHMREEFTKGKSMGVTYAGAFLMALLTAFVLALYVNNMEAQTAAEGAEAALWPWLGFILPVLASGVLWERKSFKAFAIAASNTLLTMVVTGVILAIW